jgi:predicted small integral membrane protein
MLGNIVSDYTELWMYFTWQGQEVVLKRDMTTKLQIIMLKQLNGSLDSPS